MLATEHVAFVTARALVIACGAAALSIGIAQMIRTLRFGTHLPQADDVIRRAGITIGVGIALLYAGSAS